MQASPRAQVPDLKRIVAQGGHGKAGAPTAGVPTAGADEDAAGEQHSQTECRYAPHGPHPYVGPPSTCKPLCRACLQAGRCNRLCGRVSPGLASLPLAPVAGARLRAAQRRRWACIRQTQSNRRPLSPRARHLPPRAATSACRWSALSPASAVIAAATWGSGAAGCPCTRCLSPTGFAWR